MNIIDQANKVLDEINKSKTDCQNKLELLKTKIEELKKEAESIEIPNRWDDLNDLRTTIKNSMHDLKQRALSELDPMKILEARQDITMWLTRGEFSSKMISLDINNKDSVRLKAWLSINQENLNTNQRFNRQPLEEALVNSMFENEQRDLEYQLSQIEGVIHENTHATRYIDHIKSSIKSSGLA